MQLLLSLVVPQRHMMLGMPHEAMQQWMRPGRYVGGREFAAAGVAELVELKALPDFNRNGRGKDRGRRRS